MYVKYSLNNAWHTGGAQQMSAIVIITIIILVIPKQLVNWQEWGSQGSILKWRKNNQDFWHQVEMISNKFLICFLINSLPRRTFGFCNKWKTGPMWIIQFCKVVKAWWFTRPLIIWTKTRLRIITANIWREVLLSKLIAQTTKYLIIFRISWVSAF